MSKARQRRNIARTQDSVLLRPVAPRGNGQAKPVNQARDEVAAIMSRLEPYQRSMLANWISNEYGCGRQ